MTKTILLEKSGSCFLLTFLRKMGKGAYRKMRDKTLVVAALLVGLIMLSLAVAPLEAFVYPDGSEDNLSEIFGPRVDKILIRKYASFDAEMQGLQNGEIDITDWSLTKTWVNTLSADPNVRILKNGGEAGYYTINFNNNNNTYLGNPENPDYPNPAYPNPTSMPSIRQAIAYMIDRTALCSDLGAGLYDPIYTPIPSYMTYWIHPDIRPGGSLESLTYPFDPTYAASAALLDSGGFPVGPDGWRYWDMDEDNVKDPGEDLNLKIYSRSDTLRKGAADMLCAGLDALHVHYIRYISWPWHVTQDKNYNIYTGGWILIGADADYLYDLYHWNNYYHLGECPNFGAISKYDPYMQEQLENIKFAANVTGALKACRDFQERFAEVAAEIPLASASAPKAYNKWYTGGNDGAAIGDEEDKYRGQMWTQVVNERSQGENSRYTTFNAYPEGHYFGDGSMIMRYGWKDNSMPQVLNPMYSSWYWDNEVVYRVYDTLAGRDPMTYGPIDVPLLAENWTYGTWIDPRNGLRNSKVTIGIRPDVVWSDGEPFTVDDVLYNLVQLPKELRAKGVPDVWWQSTLNGIVGACRLDEYTVEILFDADNFWAVNWIASIVMVPKHVWQPFIATHTVSEIGGDLSTRPEVLIGTGPFIYESNTENTLTLARNPLYYQTLDKSSSCYTSPISQGITVTALTPSTQLTPFKIKVDSFNLGHVHIAVPITNLDTHLENGAYKKIELVYPNGTGQVLAEELNKVLMPGEVYTETFDLHDIPKGLYTIRVTVTITSGPLFNWVTANLPQPLWPHFLGPKNVLKHFWITVPADANEDSKVDIFDIALIAVSFGSRIGDPKYDPIADLNHDGLTDIFDIVVVATWFGWES